MAKTNIKSINVFNPLESEATEIKREFLYHYTSPQGLYAILDKATLRFTDCQYLNDKSEFVHIFQPLEKAIRLMSNQFQEKIGNRVLDVLEREYQTDECKLLDMVGAKMKLRFYNMRYYVFCASSAKDDLNMWNYYTKGGAYQGYNIGFTSSEIANGFIDVKNEDILVFYGKVLYTEKEQVEFLKEKLSVYEKNLDDYPDFYNEQEHVDFAIGKVKEIINYYRLFLKDSAFSNEREYRFVIAMPTDIKIQSESLKIGYSMRNGIMTPHCDLRFKYKSKISNITISPMMEAGIAEQGLRQFLKHKGFKEKIGIAQSKIPIRY